MIMGIVSQANLLRGLARLAEDMPPASAGDRALRHRVLEALAQVPKEGWRCPNVVVRDGSVEVARSDGRRKPAPAPSGRGAQRA